VNKDNGVVDAFDGDDSDDDVNVSEMFILQKKISVHLEKTKLQVFFDTTRAKLSASNISPQQNDFENSNAATKKKP